VLHGEAVAGEGVGGVGCEDLCEGGDLVHRLMVRCFGWGWQVLVAPCCTRLLLLRTRVVGDLDL
jgi:hypothetical protein